MIQTKTFIRATGKYIPERVVPNSDFEDPEKYEFFISNDKKEERSNLEIADKLAEITGIKERRYFDEHMTTSDAGYRAAKNAYDASRDDPQKTDVFIFAHNFGDIRYEEDKFDCVPCHAARIKNNLGVENPYTVAYDIAISGACLIRDLTKLKEYLALGPNDLVVETENYELTGIYEKAQRAFSLLDVQKESLHRIIVIHIIYEKLCLAAKVKRRLETANPDALAFDVLFGCPGWLHSVSIADAFITSEKAKKIMVIGAEALSRVSDYSDPDSQIYSDGGGAIYLEGRKVDVSETLDDSFFIFASVGAGMNRNVMVYSKKYGILGYLVCSDTTSKYLNLLWMDRSYNSKIAGLYLKIKGSTVFGYAKGKVPELIKQLMDKLGININQVIRMYLHQANETLDIAMTKGVFELCCGRKDYSTDPPTPSYIIPDGLVPMTIQKYGNNSVATLPILLDEFGLQ